MLSNTISGAGVTAASGGNHGAAVAWAARELGHKATIFVPTISAEAKVERLHSYGAVVHQVGAVYAESLAECESFQASSGATAVHAYEDPSVVAGAGTVGRELAQQVPSFDTVLVACGGGGLIAGVASWIGTKSAIVACETETTNAFAAAKAVGAPTLITPTGIAADALGASQIGSLAFDVLNDIDAQSALVDDHSVGRALAVLWDRLRIVIEPSAAVGIAALLSGRWQPVDGAHTAVILCGANTSL